jgi:hypothetical protein
MKKVILLALVLSSSVGVFAQGFYGGFQTGFARGQASNGVESDDSEDSFAAIRHGSGLNLGGIIGYKVNDNIALELGLNYLLGSNSMLSSSFEGISPLDGSIVDYKETYTYKSSMMRICPTMVVSMAKEGITPYVKFGAVIGVGSKIKEIVDSKQVSFADFGAYEETENYTAEYSGGVSLGVTSSLGIKFPISEKLSFFSELNFIGLNWAPQRSEVTSYKYEIDGIEVADLSDLDDYSIYTNYVESIDTDDEIDVDDPSEAIKEFILFNSLGINVGLNFGF